MLIALGTNSVLFRGVLKMCVYLKVSVKFRKTSWDSLTDY